MKTIRFWGLVVLLTLVSIINTSCQKDDEKSNSSFPSIEWYESIIPHGTFQYENISDVYALYKSYTFNEDHSFAQYVKAAERTMNTDGAGNKTYTKWIVITNETKKGTWHIIIDGIPELQLSYENGSSRIIDLYDLHNSPDSFYDDNGYLFKREYGNYVGPTF